MKKMLSLILIGAALLSVNGVARAGDHSPGAQAPKIEKAMYVPTATTSYVILQEAPAFADQILFVEPAAENYRANVLTKDPAKFSSLALADERLCENPFTFYNTLSAGATGTSKQKLKFKDVHRRTRK